MSTNTVGRLLGLRPHLWKTIGRMSGVTGLGVGVVPGTSRLAWRVYVDSADTKPSVPDAFAGFPVVVMPRATSFQCYGNDRQGTLRPGIEIKSKVGGEGTLGGFARLRSDPTRIVILSNSHVLYGDVASMGGSGDGADVGQPSVSCCCCCKCRVVAVNRANLFTLARVRVTHPTLPTPLIQSGSEVDAAIAVLNNSRPYTNQSEFYGMITGTPPSGLGVAGGDSVEMVGSTSGHKRGTILQFTTTTTYLSGGSGTVPNVLYPFEMQGTGVDENFAGAMKNINQFLVLPDPDPQDPTRKMTFAQGGDSGSVVVNAARQVIGIVVRTATLSPDSVTGLNAILPAPLPPHAGGLGIVCPIGPVLRLLDIEIVNAMAGTAPAAGDDLQIPEQDLAREREEAIAFERMLQGLQEEIRSRALGREIMDAIDGHRPEVERLARRKREVTVAWHRAQGPAYAAHVLHSLRDHRYQIPREVRGVTPAQAVRRMADALRRHGSDALRADVDRYLELALDWASDATSVWQLIQRMRRLEPDAPVERRQAATVL
jgi:hypothetical protein